MAQECPGLTQDWALIFSDEASFRQDCTLYATWSRIGQPPQIPVTGERKSVKILGAIELFQTRFHYRQETVFNASTYLGFLKQLAVHYRRHGAILIQDNASYRKDREVWSWFGANRHWLEVHQVHQLLPYSPAFNPTERFRQCTPRTGTHNRCFSQPLRVTRRPHPRNDEMQCHPELIRPHLASFCLSVCPFIYAHLYSRFRVWFDAQLLRILSYFLLFRSAGELLKRVV